MATVAAKDAVQVELPAAGSLFWDYLSTFPVGLTFEFDLSEADLQDDDEQAAMIRASAVCKVCPPPGKPPAPVPPRPAPCCVMGPKAHLP